MIGTQLFRSAFRGIVAVAVLGVCGAPFAQTSALAVTPTGPGSLAGIWQSSNSRRSDDNRVLTLGSLRTPERDRVVRTIDGSWPPLQPWASELLEKRISRSQQGAPEVIALTQCLPGMPVMMLGGPYPIQILETPGQVTILMEEQNHFRLIYLNGKHPEDPDPTFLGHSVGHWQGNTLVVDTIGLTDRTTIDRVGMPHSEALHLIERYRRTGKDTLEIVMTLDDAKTFTKPWDAKVIYRAVAAGVEMTEYVCENNRDLPGEGK
jgi:hypothetical protein